MAKANTKSFQFILSRHIFLRYMAETKNGIKNFISLTTYNGGHTYIIKYKKIQHINSLLQNLLMNAPNTDNQKSTVRNHIPVMKRLKKYKTSSSFPDCNLLPPMSNTLKSPQKSDGSISLANRFFIKSTQSHLCTES